jgi:Peptidase family C25
MRVAGQNSVLSASKWFRVSVAEDGIYQIDHALLKKLGAGPDNLNPTTLKLFGYPTGMLPQANNVPRQKDLQEIAIMVTGEADGKFNTGDKIFFFGQGPDAHYYNPAKETFWYANHLYSDFNYYFITFGGGPGKRIAQKDNVTGSFPLINQYVDFARFEEDKENILKSGREWFGFEFDSKTEASIGFDMEGIIENSTVTLISRVMARAFEPASFKVLYNNVLVGEQPITTVANSSYAAKGRMRTDTLKFSAANVGAATSTSQIIKYQFVKTGTAHSVGYHDNFLVSVKRKISLYGDQTIFSLMDGLVNNESTVEMISSSVDPMVWDVTDPFNTKNQIHSYSNGKAVFGTTTQPLKIYAAFNPQKNMGIPKPVGEVVNQNLQTMVPAKLLIIAHPDFASEAVRLAEHRQSSDGISAVVVSPQEIYNEYSGGKQDVTALRDFVRDVYLKSSMGLKYVLLFGRGSYDYKDRILGNSNFVPVYESRNSLSPLETYASDDYFGFLESHEGEWSESNTFDHTLDVGVGRLPVRTVEEAAAVVDKLIEYDLSPKARGQWKTDIVFVGDDGDYNIHQGQANQLATQVEALNPSLHAKKIYLDLFPQVQKPFGQISTDATNTLFRAFHEGALIINFTGHGSEQLWMQERMLDPIFVSSLQNRYRYPFLITATCEFGRTDDPMVIASAEKLLVRKNAGTIGLVTTSRPVNSSSNFAINSDFYESFLVDTDSKGKPIGAVFKTTKNRGNLGVSNRNFSLLGDPSMTIWPGQREAVVTELKDNQGNTIINGLTEYNLKGQVRSNWTVDPNFNGQAEIRIFAKPSQKTTKGDENPAFQFSEYEKMIFQGKARVSGGSFETTFLTSSLSETAPSFGKMILYASSPNTRDQAIGNLAVGIGTENGNLVDAVPPKISLFINDTTFINGGISNEDPILLATLEDNSGIDISGSEARQITATLDGDTTFNVTPYFVYRAGQHRAGTIAFQMFALAEGKHSIELRAFDVAANASTARVEFTVGEQNQLQVANVVGWPNPFSEKVKIAFFHNRSGEDLEGSLLITNVLGEPVRNMEFAAPSSFFSTQIIEWDGTMTNGAKLSPGLYILRLEVRSLADGSKSESFGKLILSN